MKKKINIILILVVIALWGGVGYRFLTNYFFTRQPLGPDTNFASGTAIDNIFVQRDTFVMEPLDRDPFLNRGKPVSKQAATKYPLHTRQRSAPRTVNFTPEVKIIWPDIRYHGYIKSGDNKELVLLNINGTVKKMHTGEDSNGITVNKISKDSIEVSYQKEKRVIRHSRLR